MTTDRPVLAVDIGGTKMAAALVEADGGIVARGQVDTPPEADGERLWRALESLVESVSADPGVADAGPAGVGVGCVGPMTWPAAEVSPVNVTGWRGFPLRDRLREHFPGLPVRVHNDAVCVAVGEHWRGAGRGHDNVLGMVVSTGVGGGLVLGGRLIDGASGNAGHIGHVVVDPEGPACGCGGRGCLEAVARGPGLAAWARGRGWHGDTAKELAADAARGHPVAAEAMRRAGRALGVAIASATSLCDLELVVVGGGLSQAGALLFDPLEEAFREHAGMEFAGGTRVVPATLDQAAGLVGAAALIFAADRYWTGGPRGGDRRE